MWGENLVACKVSRNSYALKFTTSMRFPKDLSDYYPYKISEYKQCISLCLALNVGL